MAEWAAIGTVCEWICTAFAAYGAYDETFDPAKQAIDWAKYIRAAEKRIISAIKEEIFKDAMRELDASSTWWNKECVEVLRSYPISPQNLEALDQRINPRSLEEKIDGMYKVLC